MTTITTTNLIVETAHGKVQGERVDGVCIWKGIPYAHPPVGSLRFHPPQPPEPWGGVRDASQFGKVAPQLPSALASVFRTPPQAQSEDCLFLNVWSPGADGGKRPVLVWIHGGAFVTGSSSSPWYNGVSFAANGDVVVVTVNYRLGALGFLHLADLGGERYEASGLCGILDQVRALEWVRDNIAAFGGDPANVTIFGESAGAMSIGTLMALPAARGLFHKAILQSGACHYTATREQGTHTAEKILHALGLTHADAAKLQETPVEKLLEAQAQVLAASAGLLPFQPVVDGRILPRRPREAVADGAARGVPTLVGTNRDEMRLWLALTPDMANPNEAVLQGLFGARAHEVLSLYMAQNGDHTASDAWLDIMSDRTFRIPAIRVAEAQARTQTPVWMYRFDWRTPLMGGIFRSCHALEIPFVWNNLDKPGSGAFTGDSPARYPLAERMHHAWIAFACSGDPNGGDLSRWSPYDLARRETFIFDEQCALEDDPQSAERQVWDGIL